MMGPQYYSKLILYHTISMRNVRGKLAEIDKRKY